MKAPFRLIVDGGMETEVQTLEGLVAGFRAGSIAPGHLIRGAESDSAWVPLSQAFDLEAWVVPPVPEPAPAPPAPPAPEAAVAAMAPASAGEAAPPAGPVADPAPRRPGIRAAGIYHLILGCIVFLSELPKPKNSESCGAFVAQVAVILSGALLLTRRFQEAGRYIALGCAAIGLLYSGSVCIVNPRLHGVVLAASNLMVFGPTLFFLVGNKPGKHQPARVYAGVSWLIGSVVLMFVFLVYMGSMARR